MLQQFTLYIILGLVALMIILGGGWWYPSGRASTMGTLKANNVRLEERLPSTNERSLK